LNLIAAPNFTANFKVIDQSPTSNFRIIDQDRTFSVQSDRY